MRYFLFLKSYLRGPFSLSDTVGTRNFLKNEEEILIRLELTLIWHTLYAKAKVVINGGIPKKDMGFTIVSLELDHI